MDLAAANEKLEQVPGGKAHLRGNVRSDVPLLKQLFKMPPKPTKKKLKVTKGRADTTKAIKSNNTSPPSEHIHEHSTWVNVAVEDITRGLKRLAEAASDLHKIDDSKTIEEYYSEILANVVKEADVKFDPKYLQ